MRNVYIQAGTVNGGANLTSGYEKLIGKDYTQSIFFALNYQRLTRTVEVIPIILKEQNTFLSAGYRKYFPVAYRGSPYLGISVLAGYQYVGYSQSGMYEHFPSEEFLYGGGAHAGIEYQFSPLSFFLEGAYMLSNELDHSWILGVGVKYYF